MPFGLRNAGQTFQRFINNVLHGLDFCLPYLDDILIASTNEEQHLEHLAIIFQRLADHGLKLNPAMCHLGLSSVSFLGCQISATGIQPLTDKVQAILDYPEPTTIQHLHRFLGMLNYYRRFLPHTAQTWDILFDSIKGAKKRDKRPLALSTEAKAAFQQCKDLANAAILVHPTNSAHLGLMVDSSSTHIGAALQQYNHSWQPLAFFSKKLSVAQQRYSTYDRELFAAYATVKHFRHLLEGTQFTIFTDHLPLTFALRQRYDNASPRQIRHLDFLAQFTSDIQHIKGKDNIVADALSRLETVNMPAPIDFTDMAAAQSSDKELEALLQNESSSLTFQKLFHFRAQQTNCTATLPQASHALMFPVHSDTSSLQQYTTILILASVLPSRQSPNVRCGLQSTKMFPPGPAPAFLANYLKSTVIRPALQNLPSARFEHIHLDLIGPLPPSQGFTYCFTIADRFTRWPEAIPIPDITADTVARNFYSSWVCRFGAPDRITTDQARQFESAFFSALTQLLGASPYHPCTNSIIERFHRPLEAAIKCHATHKWVDILPTILLGFCTTFKEDVQATSAELLYGSTIRLPGKFLAPASSSPEVNPATFVGQLEQTMQSLRPTSTSHHSRSTVFVHKDLTHCTHVFVHNDGIKNPLQLPYDGPYQVLSRAERTCSVSVKGQPTNISIDRPKPAYLLSTDDPTSNKPSCEPSRPVSSTGTPSDHNSTPQLDTLTTSRHARKKVTFKTVVQTATIPSTTIHSGRIVKVNTRYLS